MHGLGAFAIRPIPAGTRLIEYAGERIMPDEADARYPDQPGVRHHIGLFAIDDDIVIDASVGGNYARFINHACDPNCDAPWTTTGSGSRRSVTSRWGRNWRTTTPSC